MYKKGTSMKYEFTGETKEFNGITLRRIRRISDGLIGGWVEFEKNLSQEGTCFVDGEARICGNARVSGNARVFGNALVYGNAQVYRDAQISGKAGVFGDAWVSGNASVSGDACIYGNACVSGDARVYGISQVYENAKVYGNAQVYGTARVYGDARIHKEALVTTCLYIQQPRHNITATDTHAFIGCEGHTWEYWFENIQEIGEKHDYSQEEIEDTRGLLLILQRQLKRRLHERIN